MNIKKMVVVGSGLLAVGWFFKPTLKLLKYALPAFIALGLALGAWSCSSVAWRTNVFTTTNTVTRTQILYDTREVVVTNFLYKTETKYNNVYHTNIVAKTEVAYVTNVVPIYENITVTNVVVCSLAIGADVGFDGKRQIDMDGKRFMAKVIRYESDNSIKIIYDKGVWNLNAASPERTQAQIYSLNNRGPYEFNGRNYLAINATDCSRK